MKVLKYFSLAVLLVVLLPFVTPSWSADPTVVLQAQRDRVTHARIVLTTTSETTLIAAGGAGVLRDLVMVTMTNESATEVRVDIRDATAGTIRLSIDLVADGGTAIVPFLVPLKQAVANNNWTAQLSAALSSIYITAVTINN